MVTTGVTTASAGLPPPPVPSIREGGPAEILSGNPRAVLENRGMTVTPNVVYLTPERSSSADWFIPLLSLLIAGAGTLLTYRLLRWREKQEYIMARTAGLTLEEDIKRVEARLEKSAGDRDHWHTEFLTDMKKVAANGLLRPARCREDDILDLMNLRKRNLPVIRTVVAPPGAGKSRMAEGLVHALYHDRSGNHFSSSHYDPKNRLFADVDPTKLLCYRLNLGQLTNVDAEAMFHYLMQKADRCVKDGGKCLVIIDEVQYLYEPNGHASAARLIHNIGGWTDGQMQHNKGLWGVAMAPSEKYKTLIHANASRRRRFEEFPMRVLSGGQLRVLVDEMMAEWETSRNITIPADVRDRAVELMKHPKNDLANPYAVLNLQDRVQADMNPGETMTRADVDRSFARLFRLDESEIAHWTIYPQVLKSIQDEFQERFPFLKDVAPQVLVVLAMRALTDWKLGDQTLVSQSKPNQPMVPERFLEGSLAQVYQAIESQPFNLRARELMTEMRVKDTGGRDLRKSNVRKLPVAPTASEALPAATA